MPLDWREAPRNRSGQGHENTLRAVPIERAKAIERFNATRDWCAANDIPFFFKWIGVPDLRNLPGGSGPGFGAFDRFHYDMQHECVRIGKKAAGALLDGVEHKAMPRRQTTACPGRA